MGGSGKGGARPAKPVLEPNMGESQFARALGSSDFHTREAGLQALTTWLARKADISELDLLKLWKGVFYCFWHSDKAAVQTALAERLGELMLQLPEQTGWLYYQCFVRTMRREWFGIDRLRLDKFMMLMRKVFAALLRQLQQHQWQQRRVQRLADFWLAEILLPGDTLVAAGVAYHLTDLLLPELAACLADGGSGGAAPDDATLRLLLEPFCRALAGAPNPAMVYRLRQGVFDPLVEEVRQAGEAAALPGLDTAALAAHLFDLGAQPETSGRNREALYAVSSALEKAAAKRQRRGQGQPEQQQQQRKPRGSEPQAAATAAPANGAKPQRGAAGEAAAQQQQQQQAEAAAAQQLTPGGKKGKKRRQAGENGAPGASPAPQAAAGSLEGQAQAELTPAPAPPTSGGKKGKKSRLAPAEAAQLQAAARQQQPADVPAREQELLAAALAAVTGAGGDGGGTPGSSSPSKKKNVRFSLKRNLVNVIGQPPKPADVRTPPTFKPKGSALKKDGLVGGPSSAPERLLTRAGMGRLAQFQAYMNGKPAAPGSATRAEAGSSGGKKQQQKRRMSAPVPGSSSRPRASEFF